KIRKRIPTPTRTRASASLLRTLESGGRFIATPILRWSSHSRGIRARDEEEYCRRRLDGGHFFATSAGRSLQHLFHQRGSRFKREVESKCVGVLRVVIHFI